MHLAKPSPHGREPARPGPSAALIVLPLLLTALAVCSLPADAASGGTVLRGVPVTPVGSAFVNFTDLARLEMLGAVPPVRPLLLPELEAPPEPPPPFGSTSLRPISPTPLRLLAPQVASPPPTNNFMGLDDIPMVDSSYIIIPPDVDGAVGISKILQGLNNNYRILDKGTGATISTVGTATFWAPTGAVLNALTDPRTIYDPYTNRWIAVMQTIVGGASDILVGVSQTSDPSGGWFLYRYPTASTIDFPTVGFNKNWIVVAINKYNAAGTAFANGITLVVNYPQARIGAGSAVLFSMPAGTHFTASPAGTYSAIQDTEFVVTHLSSAGATYSLDQITGTPAAPVYAIGGTLVRPGGGWTQPGGNILPQSAPVAGASVCAPPCRIESQDAQVRSTPVWRDGSLWYTQTIGLPAGGLTHTSVQWTRLLTPIGAFLDGGRIDDPAATATNGGKWHAYPHIAVNAAGEFMVGFSQFSSDQHPSAGYAMHLAGDGAGTLRDPLIYHAGEDYYHKTFTTATGRNRWGDFSKAQVDPCDDMSLWTVQEYAKARTATANDGNTGANSSRWSTWWALVGGPQRVAGVVCPPDTIGTPGGPVIRVFRILNNGAGPDQFSYSVTDAAGWGGASGTTPVLAPAGFFDVFVTFNLPTDCNPNIDVATLSVTPAGAVGCYTPQTCNTKIFCDIATATLVSRFDARMAASGVDLSWASDAVGEVEGWNVYRSQSGEDAWVRVNTEPVAMRSGGQFSLHDDTAVSGDVFYRLNALLAGGAEQTASTTRLAFTGQAFSFAVAGGNPFTGGTTLRFTLPRAEHVRVDVFSITGQRVRTLTDRMETPGSHTLEFSLRGEDRTLSPGVYLVRITAGANRRTLRLVGIE